MSENMGLLLFIIIIAIELAIQTAASITIASWLKDIYKELKKK